MPADHKLILIPEIEDWNEDLELVVIPHPKSSNLCQFIYNNKRSCIYELKECSERLHNLPISAFYNDLCISKLVVYIGTIVDPLFFFIPLLNFARKKEAKHLHLKKVIYEYCSYIHENFQEEQIGSVSFSISNLRKLLIIFLRNPKLIEKITSICDVINIDSSSMDNLDFGENCDFNHFSLDNRFYLLNDEKLQFYLFKRIELSSRLAIEQNILLKEHSDLSSKSKGQTQEFCVDEDLAKITASDLVLTYIPNNMPQIIGFLQNKYNEITLNLKSRFRENSNSDSFRYNKITGVKRPISTAFHKGQNIMKSSIGNFKFSKMTKFTTHNTKSKPQDNSVSILNFIRKTDRR
ncbi:uncharacterized protein CMU_035740 [Cryptosporidium muris RN66]|uniref:Uncharacterized protein n=1 Tax=Cryptosporidium muris (strain RN66) TaxID=441375 RepID=B6AGR0_CRYMR|nr:uncharacterized protein CMU_035740 [Cryptosporidium muris RN66]EEA07401.1 hypothetical protein CMU_035740 [Cryptosporidium muris RN66]|eukprot:XP_002141750.1 hypothetical protein [Cryptosporidium muris RN66]